MSGKTLAAALITDPAAAWEIAAAAFRESDDPAGLTAEVIASLAVLAGQLLDAIEPRYPGFRQEWLGLIGAQFAADDG